MSTTSNASYGELTVKDILGWTASGAMIFGGIVPYIPQYRQIKQKEDTEGFSLYVCLTLLIANTLRILFWFGKRYEIPLLLQSILMIITMFTMVKVCVNVRNKTEIIRSKDRFLKADLDSKFFWKWTHFQSYLNFMLLFAAFSAFVMYVFVDIPIFVELVGFSAVLTEAMLGIPQLITNFCKKSTSGMSIAMVMMWMVGDAFKTCYFVGREAPVQFSACGMLQVIVDVAILLQVYMYQNQCPVIRSPTRSD